MFAGWAVLATAWSAGRVDVGARLMSFHTFRNSPDPVRIRFPLHKEVRAAEIEFHLHKDLRAAGIELYLHKEFLKKIHE